MIIIIIAWVICLTIGVTLCAIGEPPNWFITITALVGCVVNAISAYVSEKKLKRKENEEES